MFNLMKDMGKVMDGDSWQELKRKITDGIREQEATKLHNKERIKGGSDREEGMSSITLEEEVTALNSGFPSCNTYTMPSHARG